MTVQTKIHFRFGEETDSVVAQKVTEAIKEFDAAGYGVTDVSVIGHIGRKFTVFFGAENDADLDRATDAFSDLIETIFGD